MENGKNKPLPVACAVKPACIGKISTACALRCKPSIAPTSRTAMTAAVTGSRKEPVTQSPGGYGGGQNEP